MVKLLFLLLIPSYSFAGGQLEFRQPVLAESANRDTEFGLYINEQIYDKIYYQSWTGGRINNWFSTQQNLMYSFGSVSVGAGPQVDNFQGDTKVRVNGVLSWKLW